MTRPKAPFSAVSPVLRYLADRSLRGEGPITYHVLARAVGVHQRIVRLAVRHLVEAGHPILTSSDQTEGGYFLCRDARMIREYADKMKHRATAIFVRAQALEATADRLERESGQPQPSLPLVHAA